MPKYLNFPEIVKNHAPFSSIVLDDRYAFVAGVVAADTTGGLKILGDIALETAEVMDTIARLLAEIGLGMADMVRVDVHLTDIADMEAMNAVYRTYFEPGAYPARTCVQSEGLFGGSLIEVTCMARLKENS